MERPPSEPELQEQIDEMFERLDEKYFEMMNAVIESVYEGE